MPKQPMKPVAKKTAAKVTAKKTAVKPKASTTAKPKSSPNLKKGGLAPASQQVKINQLRTDLKYAIDSDWSANHPIKAHKLMRKTEKELGAIYKKLGYNKVRAEDFSYNKRSESWKG